METTKGAAMTENELNEAAYKAKSKWMDETVEGAMFMLWIWDEENQKWKEKGRVDAISYANLTKSWRSLPAWMRAKPWKRRFRPDDD
jgi:hypothetical protein